MTSRRVTPAVAAALPRLRNFVASLRLPRAETRELIDLLRADIASSDDAAARLKRFLAAHGHTQFLDELWIPARAAAWLLGVTENALYARKFRGTAPTPRKLDDGSLWYSLSDLETLRDLTPAARAACEDRRDSID